MRVENGRYLLCEEPAHKYHDFRLESRLLWSMKGMHSFPLGEDCHRVVISHPVLQLHDASGHCHSCKVRYALHAISAC